MSTATTVPDTDCRYCGDPVPDHRAAADKSYCSERCYIAQRGDKLLDYLKHDHRVCATCYRVLADTYRPDTITSKRHGETRTPPDNFIGYKSRTPNTERLIDEFQRDPEATIRIEGTRWGCGGCGTVNHRDTHAFLQALDEAPTARRLYERLCELAERGAIDDAPDHDRFVDGWQDGGPALAAGLACYG